MSAATTRRVVSLVPSSTETLLALGADVIACTRFCEQPGLPTVGGTKNPDIEAVIELRPDLVVVDREENRLADHDLLVAAGLDVFVSHVIDIASACAVVGELARAADVDMPPHIVDSLDDLVSSVPDRSAVVRAFVPIWRRPWMTIGDATYGADVLRVLGIDVVGPDPGSSIDAYPTVDLESIARARPDLVVVPSEPYTFTAEHLDELRAACPTATVVEVDGQDLFWWGTRTPTAIRRLRAALALPATG